MKISLVTVCYNSAATIEDTIKSVLSQSYPDVEYIIIDGNSKDNTLAIINQYKDKIATVVSEPDKGIYDAMNKGLKLATGDIIGIINSDDFYATKQTLAHVAEVFADPAIDGCYGDLAYVERADSGKIVRFWKGGEYAAWKLRLGWIPPHPTFFVRRAVYQKHGLFNTDFRIAADYELLLRLCLFPIKLRYIPECLVYMREGGFSARSLKQRWRGWKELYRAWRVNNKRPPMLLVLTRVVMKIPQYWSNQK